MCIRDSLITLHGCRRHVRTGQLDTFIIMLTENLKQSTVYRGILTLETVSYTHLDYQANFRFAHAETVIPFVSLMGIEKTIYLCRRESAARSR